MLPWSKSAAGGACQGNNKRCGVLATAALFSKTGSIVEKQCCLGGRHVGGWQPRAPACLLPSLQLLGSVSPGGLGDAGD